MEKRRVLVQDPYPYPELVKASMRKFYNELSEKDRRIYATVESLKFGFGGKSYVCGILGCDEKTLNKGLEDFAKESKMPPGKQRQAGGGKKNNRNHRRN